MLDSITTLILTIVGAFIASVLYDRFKRPTPFYIFEFEKKIPYQATLPSHVAGITISAFGRLVTLHLENYIRLENYGSVELLNVATEIHFDGKKEQRYYRKMKITEDLFNLEIEHLSTQLPPELKGRLSILSLQKSESEVTEEKTKTGFFIGSSDMQKLKTLSPIKIKVEYEWNNKKDSDIWFADFSDENEVRFWIRSPAIWRKIIRFFKRRFL